MGDYMEREILDSLKRIRYGDVAKDVQKVLEHPALKRFLSIAEAETTEKYMNKHGVTHGCTVVQNIVSLFELIRNEDLKSDYINQKFLKGKKEVLFSLVTAGYLHDIGRFYDPEVTGHEANIGCAIDFLQGMIENEQILGWVAKERIPVIREKIRELCLCHGNKEMPSNSVEVALVKVADALDCSRTRVYTEQDIPELRTDDNAAKRRLIFSRDRQPEHYYGCYAVKKVNIDYAADEGIIDIILDTEEEASSLPIGILLKAIRNCNRGWTDSTKDLSKRLRVYVHREGELYPNLLYPEDSREVQRSPYAELISSKYEVTIEDMSGKAKIINIFNIRNVTKKKLESYRSWAEGPEQVEWNLIDSSAFMLCDDTERQLKIRYLYPENKGKRHWCKILFKDKSSEEAIPITRGQSCLLKVVYVWPNAFNVEQDEFVYIPANPIQRLDVKITLPMEISEKKIETYAEIRDASGPIWRDEQLPTVCHSDDGRKVINITFGTGPAANIIRPPYEYVITWRILQAQ